MKKRVEYTSSDGGNARALKFGIKEFKCVIQSHLYSDIKKMYGNDTFVR